VPGGAYADDAVDVGGGLRPELVGQGLGRAFLDAIAAAAGRRFAGRALRATVAAFNRRALKLVTGAGFVEVERFRRPDDLEFVVLVRRGAK
jgi:RimJ/RimL family protein N-acetyltransferase